MKIYYWSPFFTNIATIKAVINSANSFIRFSKDKSLKVSLIDSIGEWDNFENIIEKKIEIVELSKTKLINYLPKDSYIKSRLSYIIIFIWNFLKLKNLINKDKPDYLIIHLMTSLPILLSPFLNKDTKIILRISGLPKINIFRYFFWKFFSKNLYKITCPTQATYKHMLKKGIFEKNKLEVLYDPIINIKEIGSKKNEEINLEFLKNRKYILGIGRLTKQKNFSLLIKFFHKVQRDDLMLVILGIGEKKNELKKLVNQFNLNDKVHFLGQQNNVFKFLKNSECFVLTSLWEDPGFVIVEAGMSNAPIISSNCPNGPIEIVGSNGFLYENNKLDDLVDKYKSFKKFDYGEIFKKKILLKKNLSKFTLFQHHKNFSKILKKRV